LDPAWYYTSPGLAWDAMLKRTGIRLELLTDIDPPSCIRQRPRTSSEYKKCLSIVHCLYKAILLLCDAPPGHSSRRRHVLRLSVRGFVGLLSNS